LVKKLQRNQDLYKKALFLSAKRALPENELILRNFAENVVQTTYIDKKLHSFITLIDKLDDLTLYDVITNYSNSKDLSIELQEIVGDINKFIKNSIKYNKSP
jgi:succinate dehydrogenase flavin-adding protein (antitoxin of CptAB toxin-antitoxin module)